MAISPTPGTTVQRPDLGMALAAFDLDMALNGFIGQRVLPLQEVAEKIGNYGRFKATELARDEVTLKAPGAAFRRIDFKFTQDNYACLNHGIEIPLDDDFVAAYKYIVGNDRSKFELLATQIGRNIVMLAHEKRIASAVFNPTTFTAHAVGTEWDTVATARPDQDVKAGIEGFRASFGQAPDALIVSSEVFRNLKMNATIRELIKYDGKRDPLGKNITPKVIADALDLEDIIVGDSMRPTAVQGSDTPAFVDVWDDEYAMLAKISKPMVKGDIGKPGLGRSLHWNGNNSVPGGIVEMYYSDELMCWVIRVRHDVVEKIEVVEAGYLLSNITT